MRGMSLKELISQSRKMVLLWMSISLVLFCAISASAESDLNDREELWLDTKVIIPVKFVEEGSDPSLDYLKINYSWIPENDYRQELVSYDSKPRGQMKGDYLLIDVSQPNDFNLEVDFSTYTTSDAVKVKDKVQFPLKGIDSSIMKYTKPSENIDINDDIRKKATELAAGENDLYVVVFNIADWVNSNIEYNLSSATVDASLPSSWVLENRYGVCDEISNLFISMCRSLGIPARFVSGISYTDDPQFQNEWGAHGWAEVYFPGYGWIPFDPTYDQLGYVDATHIKFDAKLEGDKNALEYTWVGNQLDIESGALRIVGVPVNQGELVEDDFSIDINFMKNEVALGSYNVVTAVLQNNRDYYVAAQVGISRTEDLENIGEETQDVLLLPHEKKMLHWIIKVGELDSQYIYTFPVTVYSSKEEKTEKFQAQEGAPQISLRTAENFIASNQVYISGPKLECSSPRQTVYENEIINITCKTNVEKYIRLCIDDSCTSEKFLTLTKYVNMSQRGFSTIQISASDSWGGDKSFVFLSFNVLDEANVSMEINHPEKIMFDEKNNIQVSIKRESNNIPQNATIKIEAALLSQVWNLQNIDENKEFVLEIQGKYFMNGKNQINASLNYYDEMGKNFEETKTFEIELYNLTLWQKVYVWLNGVFLTI